MSALYIPIVAAVFGSIVFFVVVYLFRRKERSARRARLANERIRGRTGLEFTPDGINVTEEVLNLLQHCRKCNVSLSSFGYSNEEEVLQTALELVRSFSSDTAYEQTRAKLQGVLQYYSTR